MKTLREQRVWQVYSAELKGTVGTDLMPWGEAAELMARLVGGNWPPAFAIALDLTAAGVICLTLLNAWDGDRDCIREGADMWCDVLADVAYIELCHEGYDGRAIRCITRGTLPDKCSLPSSVVLQTSGMVTLTGDTISGKPAWQQFHWSGTRPQIEQQQKDIGVIRDCSEALLALCGEQKSRYAHQPR